MNCPKIQQHLNLHQQIQFQQFVEFLDGLEVLGSEKIGQTFTKLNKESKLSKIQKNWKLFCLYLSDVNVVTFQFLTLGS